MFPRLVKRPPRRQLVLEFNPHQVLAAEISQPQRGRVILEAMAEFDGEDVDGLNQWLGNRPWRRVICGLVPQRSIMQRETLDPRQMANAAYLADTVEEQQKGQFLSATPFKIVNPDSWTLRAVDALEGRRLPHEGAPQPAVICGIANDEVRQVQGRLLDEGLVPERIEAGLLSLFGAVAHHIEERNDAHAVAIVILHAVASTVYILGKEGVHTPTPILHGLDSVVEVAKKELGIKDEAEVRRLINSGNPEILQRAERLVRRIGRDLKPVLDSYEMTTGHPLDEIYCAYLPPNLGWLGEALAKTTGRLPATIDCAQWMATVGLQMAPDVAAPGPHWLGALSLVARLPYPTRISADRTHDESVYLRPWHVDYMLPGMSAERLAANRRVLASAVAFTLLLFALVLTAWQLYANASLKQDLGYWEREMETNRRLFEELSASNNRLQAQSAALGQAYALMAMPFPLSNFLIDLGRTVPAHMRVDRIETNDARAAISGVLFEPAEDAADTLGAYRDGLRRNPAIGPLFSSISITSLQRKADSDAVLFEITLRLKSPPP